MGRRRKLEGNIYRRGEALWLWYWDTKGERQFGPTGLSVGRESDARALLKRTIAADRRMGELSADGTFRAFFEGAFLEHRKGRVVGWRDEETRIRLHALTALGDLQLRDISWREIEALIGKLTKKGLAPRTVRNVIGVLRLLFRRAIKEGLLERDPLEDLEPGTLPAKADKDPEWRRTAVFSRQEIAALVLDPRVPAWRRIDYALAFFTGARGGERYFLRWRHLVSKEPLAELAFVGSFNVRVWREGSTKTKVVRYLPVHPLLEDLLATWRSSGWAAYMGREPGADDYVLPYRRAYLKLKAKGDPERRTQNLCWQHLNEQDLPLLGFRPRRAHDFRRTMISLAVADGAQEHILSTLTHPSPAKAFALYKTLPWETLCREISRIRLSVTRAVTVPLEHEVVEASRSPRDRTKPDVNAPSSPDGWVAERVRRRARVTAVTESDRSGFEWFLSHHPEAIDALH